MDGIFFYGLYRGVCVDAADPEGRGRIRARVPLVTGDAVTGWVWPCRSPGATGTPVPGQGIFVMYEAGDPDFPIWIGVFSNVS